MNRSDRLWRVYHMQNRYWTLSARDSLDFAAFKFRNFWREESYDPCERTCLAAQSQWRICECVNLLVPSKTRNSKTQLWRSIDMYLVVDVLTEVSNLSVTHLLVGALLKMSQLPEWEEGMYSRSYEIVSYTALNNKGKKKLGCFLLMNSIDKENFSCTLWNVKLI